MKLSPLIATLILLVGCGPATLPERTVHVCLDQEGVSEEIVQMFRNAAERHGYEFYDNGWETKEGLLRISKDKSIIPTSRPTNFHVSQKDGTVVLMGTNFGSAGRDLIVSFFYQGGEGERTAFNRRVMSGIRSIPNSRVQERPEGATESPCI